ncbi:Complement C4-A [Holothuria leucospilota]|uniref:Complement C4-A n=1 Tax=Holothuria leucospilota TaxID=206669 RepID=A0A9Q1H154_HOLLE|nr:Complement C4-A [Holothuria leucospilota]
MFFNFDQDPMFGHWKIIAYYGKDLSAKTTVEFEVQEYVFPAFSVKIHPPSYILPTDENISVRVESRYTYGKPVRGRCFMKVGVHEDGEEPTILHLERVMLDAHGEAAVETATNILGEGWFEENVGRSLYIEVTVVEDATGHSENASDISAKFVRSPYMFSWTRTIRYFKKGLPYEVKADVKFMNGKPAPGVRVRVRATATIEGQQAEMILRGAQRDPWNGDGTEPLEDNTNDKGQVNFRLYVPRRAINIRILLETVVSAIDNNARLEFNIRPFESPNGNEFLVLRVPNQVVLVSIASLSSLFQFSIINVSYKAFFRPIFIPLFRETQKTFRKLDMQTRAYFWHF